MREVLIVLLNETNYTCDVDPFIDSLGSMEENGLQRPLLQVQVSADRIVYLVMNTSL